ncbi:MAG: hypothetical protein GKS05_12235 [Nitrospirales bacterium]|nr:hypothetical protein [Nitrospirales bacterium]
MAERIETLPLIICGPIVRHVDDRSVSVLVVLRKAVESVALSVFEDRNGQRGELLAFGEEATCRLGEHLHVVTISATLGKLTGKGTLAQPISPTDEQVHVNVTENFPGAPFQVLIADEILEVLEVGSAQPSGKLMKVRRGVDQTEPVEHVQDATVKIRKEKTLEWGKSYVYDMAFDNEKAGGFASLRDEGVLKSIEQITYHEYHLPAVMLPPLKVKQLHFIQASCRATVGQGLDAMPVLDDILERDWNSPRRPQQLFLTGDQIYADEVDDGLLYLLNDAAKVLLGGKEEWEEPLPGINQLPSAFGSATRKKLVRYTANFTTKAGSSHLLSLGEFFAMYLFIWSDTLWPDIPEVSPEAIPPDTDEVYVDFVKKSKEESQEELRKALEKLPEEEPDQEKRKKRAKELEDDFQEKLTDKIEKKKGGFREKKRQLLLFLKGIPKIRRGLANIATYMTFDDHEVTDDWHLNRDWVEEVYQTALGRRILMNGLAAFAVFQAWGNTPDLFATAEKNPKPRDRVLLESIADWIHNQCKAGHPAEQRIAKLVNIPFTDKQVNKLIESARKGKFPISKESVPWHFSFQHPRYEAVFLDARTQRSFPDKRYRASEHLSEEAVLEQIPLTSAEPEFTLVISPCNLMTINYFRNWVGKYLLPVKGLVTEIEGDVGRHNMMANDPDLADSWVPQTKTFENVISRLGSRIPTRDGKRRTRLVVLSGDVHFSAIMRMQYWAEKPFRIYHDDPIKDAKANVPKASPAEFIMAHLVCSGTKNEVGIFHFMHFLGYEIDDFLDNKEKLPFPEIFLGYHTQEALGEEKSSEILLNTRWFPNYRPSLIRKEPVMIPFHQRDANIKYPPPDWQYRIDAIRGESLGTPLEQPHRGEAAIFKKIAPHFLYSKKKVPGLEMISINSIAEFDFHWEGEGVLTKQISLTDKEFEAEIIKDFPAPPFQVVIDDEAFEVVQVTMTPPIGKFLKVRRGIDQTKKDEHAVGTKVRIRKSVNQIHWIMEKGQSQPTGLFEQDPKQLTRFVVPMDFEDPKYQAPNVPLEEPEAEQTSP